MNWLPVIIMGAGLVMCVIIFERNSLSGCIKKAAEFLTAKDLEWN